MDGSVLLDVAIGLTLLYLLIALFCTAIQEWIAQVTNVRATHLQQAVRVLLSNDKTPSAEAQAVLGHPLFTMLAREENAKAPSYVTSENFTNALLSKLVPAGSPLNFATLEAAVAGINNNPGLKSSLEAIVRQAEALHPVAQAEARLRTAFCGIQNWFDAGMDHASGWYKRRVRVWLILIAAVMAALTNADSVQVALKLAGDAQLRAQVATLAATAVPVEGDAKETLKALQKTAANQLVNGNIMSGLAGLPVGWQLCLTEEKLDLTKCAPAIQEGHWIVRHGSSLLVKLIGLALTAIAAALGAPFWFGLLQQLNAIRASGPKPASTTGST